MTIPDYETCMLPVLRQLADSDVHAMKELTQRVADSFSLSDSDYFKDSE